MRLACRFTLTSLCNSFAQSALNTCRLAGMSAAANILTHVSVRPSTAAAGRLTVQCCAAVNAEALALVVQPVASSAAVSPSASAVRTPSEASCSPPRTRRSKAQALLPPAGGTTISSKPSTRVRRRRATRARLDLLSLLAGGGSAGFGFPRIPGGGDGGGGGGGDGSDGESSDGYDSGEGGDLGAVWGKYYETTWFWHFMCCVCLGHTGCHLVRPSPRPQAA